MLTAVTLMCQRQLSTEWVMYSWAMQAHMCGGGCSERLLLLGQVVGPVLAARHNAQHSVLQPHRHYVHASLQQHYWFSESISCAAGSPCLRAHSQQDLHDAWYTPFDPDFVKQALLLNCSGAV